jgi:hypothetical protein
MKIQIDTNKKIIKIQEPVNLEDFMQRIKKMIPADELDEYVIEASEFMVSIPYTPTPVYPQYPAWPITPTYEPYKITCCTTTVM